MGRRTRADDFASLEDRAYKDLDPEDDGGEFDGSESDNSEASDSGGFDGREHYEDVGKSKLRKGQPAAIGPQYRGSHVSREELADESDEHDFLDGDDVTDDGSASDEEAASELGDESDMGFGLEDEDDEDVEDDEDGEENSEAATDNTSLEDNGADDEPIDRAQLKSLLNDTGRSVAASMAAATAADASKGRAIKGQRATFDSLLNSRIRLQHALIASNSTLAVSTEQGQHEKAYEGAELAALRLLDSLTLLRDSLPSQTVGRKRKRSSFTASTTNSELWAALNEQDAASAAHERAVMQKWSRKTASASMTAMQSAGRLKPLEQTTLLDVLDSHLAPNNLSRQIQRTRLPRSCAPIQQGQARNTSKIEEKNGVEETTTYSNSHSVDDVYDDADFYGVLLKELLEARNANAAVDYAAAANVEAQYQAARAAKSHSRPGADRRASKGRRLRYTVHERLQNWMAPEERGAWPARQRDELFASLFGQRLELREEEEEAGEEGKDSGDDRSREAEEEAALMLFRS